MKKGGALRKYKHLFGKEEQQFKCFHDVRLGSGYNADGNVLALNSKYMAVPWVEKGSVALISLDKPGAVYNDELKLIRQDEDNTVNSVAFNPFNTQQLLTASNEKTAMLWDIPEDGLTSDVTSPTVTLAGHAGRLLSAEFHPFVSGVAVTHGGDKVVKIWDVEKAEAKVSLDGQHKGIITEVTWNADGSQFATSAKDKFLRIFDPRSGSKVGECEAHPNLKTSRSVWCRKLNKIVSCGFGKSGSRELALFDPRKLGARVGEATLDVSSSSVMPLFDEDISVLYVCGKGDGTIHMYEVADEGTGLFELNKYKSMAPQTGVALLPKTSLRVQDIEIDRIYKLTATAIIPISFSLDRANKDFFQDDIFIDTFDGQASATADQWFAGTNASPATVSLKPKDAL